MPPDEGVVDYPIPRGEDLPRVPAVTRFALVAASPVDRCALVEARPETGRFHQVRRHLRHLGHPLVGDVNYGSGRSTATTGPRTGFIGWRCMLPSSLLAIPDRRARGGLCADAG